MTKLAICDDDASDRERIRTFVEEYANEKKLTYSLRIYESADQFLESNYVPDILFLDILMDKKDGIQLGQEIRESGNRVIVIYTTNLKEEMAKALNRIHSFGFLLKPLEKDDVYRILDDALTEIEKNMYIHTVTFKSENNTLIHLPVMDIYYFEYMDRKVKIVTKEKEYICIEEKITGIADKMEPYGFVMSHQSFVVNLYHVDKITAQSLIMDNNDEVYLAQKRVATVRKRLIQVVKETINK